MNINKLIRTVRKAKANTEEVLTLQLLTEIEVELEDGSNLVEAPVGMPSETLSCEQKFNDYLDEWLYILNKAGKEATTPQERYGEYCKQGLLIIVKDDFNKIFASKS